MEINNKVIVQINYYNKIKLLKCLNELQVKLYSFDENIIDNYDFEISKKDYYKVKKVFKSAKIIKDKTIKHYIINKVIKNVCFFSILLSTCIFIYLSSLLMDIRINSKNDNINNDIILYLKNENIAQFKFKPKLLTLKKIKNDYLLSHLDVFENIEFILKGSILEVNYVLKKKNLEIESLHNKMYALKDGIIDKILISKGNVLVKEYQYVNKDDLLVDDYLYYKDEPIFVGTQGKIFAYTYTSLVLEGDFDNKIDAYVNLLDTARRRISLNLFEEEYIYKENIYSLTNVDKHYKIAIDYILYENIIYF